MIIIVNDASILIDLLKLDLSDDFFRLPYEMHTTDLVNAEITDENAEQFQQYVKKKLINIYSFSEDEWVNILYIKAKNPPLSMADCSCLWLCEQLSATLLTSDGKLRNSAAEKGILVHGILWVFEELIQKKEIALQRAKDKLRELLEINPRLPREECLKKLKKWKP